MNPQFDDPNIPPSVRGPPGPGGMMPGGGMGPGGMPPNSFGGPPMSNMPNGPGPGMMQQMGGMMPGPPNSFNGPGGPHPGMGPGPGPPFSTGMMGTRPGLPMQTGPGPQASGKVYPPDQPMVFNPSNPNAPPIYPCGICHKEVKLQPGLSS